MTDSSSPDSSPASRNTFAHHLGMKGFLLMEGLLKLVGMKTLYRLGPWRGICFPSAGTLCKGICASFWIRPCAERNCRN